MKNKMKPTLHVILAKEDIQPEKIDEETIVVVFDVLLATTTIATVLDSGAKKVIPVLDGKEALAFAKNFKPSEVIVTGEYDGATIEGFVDPLPTHLREIVAGKTIILSTTNGTVAIKKVAHVKNVYAASLINANAVAEEVVEQHANHKVLLVCAGGTNARLAMEDFYGAGCLVSELMQKYDGWTLTDAAQTVSLFYEKNKENRKEILSLSETGKMLKTMGFAEEIQFASQKDVIKIVPQLENGNMIVKG